MNQDQEKIAPPIWEQIQRARNVSSPYRALVTETRLTPDASELFYGFRYDPAGDVRFGDEIRNDDQSLSRVVGIVPPTRPHRGSFG